MAASLAPLSLTAEASDIQKTEHGSDLVPSEEEKAVEQVQSAPIRPPRTTWILVCLGLYLGALLYGLDTTIAADVQASVYADLGNIEKLPWIGIGFPLGSVAVILLIGKLYGMFEIKWLIVGSIIVFEAGSALCGAAPNSDALIVGRVIAGIGGAGMYIGALNYISVFTSLRERPIYNALIGLAWGTGAILGPVVAGAFAGSGASWRWAFYINLPLAAVTAPIYIWLFPRYNPQPTVPVTRKLLQIDWLGALLNAGAFVIFMVVIAFSGSTFPWNSARSISLWTIGGVVLIAYVTQQAFSIFTTPKARLFPAHFLKSRTMLVLYLATAGSAAAMSVNLYYVPLLFQFTRGDNALDAAVRILPFIVLFVFSVMFVGALLPVVKYYTPWYIFGAVLVIIGGALMYRLDSGTSAGAIYGFEILIAVGVGTMFQTAYNVAAAVVDPKDVPNSIGFINVAQIGSIAIALSISGALYQNLGYNNLAAALQGYNFPEGLLRSALAGVESDVLLNEGAVVRGLALDAVVHTIGQLYSLVLSAGALIFVCGCLMRWDKLDLQSVAA